MSKQAIIDKIHADAVARAEAMISEADNKADAIVAECAEQCKSYYSASKSQIDTLMRETVSRGKTVAQLDAKKLLLKAKAELIDEVYALALEKVKALDQKTYAALIKGMLENAENGDTVTLSEREKNVVGEKDVSAIAKEKGIELTFNKKCGNFDGGVILSSCGIDKNFTLEVEIALMRDETEEEVAKKLLG